jgi:hypothetical protein
MYIISINYLAVRNTADVTSGKPIAVWSQYILGVSSLNPLVAFSNAYDVPKVHFNGLRVMQTFCEPQTWSHNRKRDYKFYYRKKRGSFLEGKEEGLEVKIGLFLPPILPKFIKTVSTA